MPRPRRIRTHTSPPPDLGSCRGLPYQTVCRRMAGSTYTLEPGRHACTFRARRVRSAVTIPIRRRTDRRRPSASRTHTSLSRSRPPEPDSTIRLPIRRGTRLPLFLIAAVLLTPAFLSAQEPGTVVAADLRVQGLSYTFEGTGAEVPYALFVPSSYDASAGSPLIVALHGLGRPYDWMMGYERFIDFAEARGFIVAAPLGYHPRGWYGSRGYGIPAGAATDAEEALPENLGELSERDVMNVLALVREQYTVDADRIYLWGHSMGGAGAYHLAARHPEIWAGIAVAAPAPRREAIDEIATFREIPTLVLHGDDDRTVPVQGSRDWVARMAELGMQHVYVEIAGGDHSLFVSRNPENLSKVFSFFDIVRKDQRGVR
jgi:poly(3-hydroxybutyrate) depolymerase